MVPDEREKIQRFILGLRHPIQQFVAMQIETNPSYAATVDMAKLKKVNEKGDNDGHKRKRKRGQEGRFSSHVGPLGSS